MKGLEGYIAQFYLFTLDVEIMTGRHLSRPGVCIFLHKMRGFPEMTVAPGSSDTVVTLLKAN